MASKLEKLDIRSVFDLLYHLPFRYEDRRLISLARQVQVGESVVIVGPISAIQNVFTKNGKRLQTATITDRSGKLAVIWFNQTYLARAIPPNSQIALFGKVEFFNKKPTLISPEFEPVTDSTESIHLRRLVPIYPETAGISSKWLRTKIYSLLHTEGIQSHPFELWALHHIHFPESMNQVEAARHRLAFDELLLLQLTSQLRKREWQVSRTTKAFTIDQAQIDQFVAQLPFNLTPSQIQSYQEILHDLAQTTPMNRLLEGDVGSGKTVVAAIAAYGAFLNGLKTVIMAPTQILAGQHLLTLSTLFTPLKIGVGLMTAQKKQPNSHILVGTQALLAKSLNLSSVGLVVIDEQHRFGVAQRSLLTAKGQVPHVLTMTATPIPRTVALAMFGDLDVSVLTDLPLGRIPIKTWVVPEAKRASAYNWITQEIIDHKAQVFVVCPFIETSESMTSVKAATIEFEKLKHIFPQFKLALLHGRMKAKEKDTVINNFNSGKIDILVSTPVVEVGIDIPGATIMVIEGADRFGLAQLHQLRGRVGRGDKQAYCLLFSDQPTARLKYLEQLQTGIELAEMDLQLRGAGNIYGTAQHGVPHFKVATYQDLDLITKAKATAAKLLPDLEKLPVLRSLATSGKIEPIQPN